MIGRDGSRKADLLPPGTGPAANTPCREPVRIERQGAGATWSLVARGAVDARGSFSVAAPLVPGATYRAVVTPHHGFWPGVSTPLTVAG